MKSKRKYFVCLGIAAICVIGGLILFNSLKSKEEKYRDEQDRVVKYLVKNYEDIRKVEFIEFEKNDISGFYRIVSIVNEDIWVAFNLRGLNGEITINYLSSKNSEVSLKPRDSKNGDVNLQDIKIIYWKGD
ncbi:hypothetical protein [Streptococcus pantholopis]|uniref:Uncharacterized protein n=1 Tax=Streptococcus pantholopis TaxID=1811193 RepID=A0A172Q7W5_9STRE|nr:hypothetical protein [Streptococcus pantholopis]AND79485.1 hypothetical protein A0O21_05305 [Streptococcus pantholopis]